MATGSHAPVVFGAAASAPAADSADADFADQAKLAARAERFKPLRTNSADNSLQGLDLLSEEEVRKRQDRANRFNTSLVDGGRLPARTGKEADQYTVRREAALTAERRLDTVHLHGVGMMKEDELKLYFADYGDSRVEWVDEASCNVCFNSSESAANAIQSLGSLAPAQEAPDGFGFTDADVSNELYLWHKGRATYQSDIGPLLVHLFMRIATVADTPKAQKTNQGRGKKAHRGKGKGRRQGQQNLQQQHKRQFEDMDGDVEMKTRGERGGKRYQMRKQKAMRQDTNMQDAEVFDGIDHHPTNAELRQAAAFGNVSMAQVTGPQTIFSAAAAGHHAAPTFQQYAPVPSQVKQTQLIDYNDV